MLIDDFNSKYLYEKHLVEDVSSSSDLRGSNANNSPTWLISLSFIDEIKQMLPLITHDHLTTYAILTHYYSNELFYANSLMNITQLFLNHEFNSFPDHLILNPDIPRLAKMYHGEIIEQLSMIYDYIIELTSIISMFNSILLMNVKTNVVSFINMKDMKAKFEYLVMTHLCDGVHEVMDSITECIYQYNMYIDQISYEEQEGNTKVDEEDLEIDYDEDDGSSYALINGLYDKIEDTLKLKTDRLTKEDVLRFHKVLTYDIIENDKWNGLIKELKELIVRECDTCGD